MKININITTEEALIIMGKQEVEKFVLAKELDEALKMVGELTKRLQNLQPKDKEPNNPVTDLAERIIQEL